MIKKIVLTGGPCAGKTTALSKIEQDLTEKGYKVFVVAESATELIKSGLRPFGNNPCNMLEFQKLIMLYQYQKEQLYNKAIENYQDTDIVVIYDRGLLDNKAYVNDAEFQEVLKSLSQEVGCTVTEGDIQERYDMVLHLVTSADGAEENYTTENNSARTEGIEEAIKMDRLTMKSWINHPNLKIIDNSTNFSDKLAKVLSYTYQLLENPYLRRKQLKYLVEVDNDTLNNIKKEATKITIEQIYLDNLDYEERIRASIQDGTILYYYTKQKKKENGESEVIINKKITESEYHFLKNTSKIKDIIHKTRYVFIIDKTYYRLDEYNSEFILEVEITDSKEISIPAGITVKKDLVKERLRVKQ